MKEQTTIRLPAELKEQLQREAEKTGVSINKLVMMATDEYLINHQK